MNKKLMIFVILFFSISFTKFVFAENVTVGCTDSDGGNNFTMKGTTIGFQNEYVSKIYSNLQTVQDFCINNQWVQEYSCMSANESSQFYGVYSATSSECSSCSDGACVSIKEITACEGSTNSSIEAYSYGAQIKVSYSDGTQQIFTDGCGISSGSGEAGIQHYFCGFASGSKPHFWSVLKSCQYGCVNGVCVNSTYVCGDGVCDSIYGENSTNCPSDCFIGPTKRCTDSDGGINYFTKGCTYYYYSNNTGGGGTAACDTCIGNTLTEGYCEVSEAKSIKYTCPSDYTCSDGACVKSTSVCGDGVCDKVEVSMMYYGQITSCPQDCGYELEPFDADVKTCTDSVGRTFTIGSIPSAPWFIWGGCAKEKYYNVVNGGKLRLHVYTDTCSGCVCYYPNFDVYEYKNGVWTLSKSFSLSNIKGLDQSEFYTPNSDKIKIAARGCFYLDVFSLQQVINVTPKGCINHDECSQACDNLGINYKWMGSGSNYRSWEGTCPSRVYGCMTGKCCLGQCAYTTTSQCFCARTNVVDIYGSVCPEGSTCGDDCYCHPMKEEFKFNIKTDKYSYSPGENVRITAVFSGNSSYNFNEAKITTIVTDSQGLQHEIKMEPIGASSSTCTQSATGAYTCSIITEYNFVGNYIINSDGPIGTWKILSTGVVGENRKNAEINFEVQKVAYDYVDVSINPKEQSTIIGKEVKYDVTITDKHPSMKCLVTITNPEIVTSAGTTTETSRCGSQIYNYLVDVGGLPYHTVFPTVISVHAGGSNTFELKVFPSSAKTAEGITTTVETTTTAATAIAERSVGITGKPIATQPSVMSTQQETTPVKEATFKFAVKAYLKEDQATSDSAIGFLHVKFIETPEPPPFPDTEKINIELNKGWNLVSVPGKGIGFIKGTCSEDQKPTAFIYIQDKQRYVSFEDAMNIMGKEELLDYLSTHSFWIYSYEDCNIGFKFKSYSTYSGLTIGKGWNLLGVTKDMIGETLSNIKGSCNFEKIYTWNVESQKWIEKSENDLIEEKGYGIVVWANEECILKTNLIQPPPFPGE